jgi:hypothetical protein
VGEPTGPLPVFPRRDPAFTEAMLALEKLKLAIARALQPVIPIGVNLKIDCLVIDSGKVIVDAMTVRVTKRSAPASQTVKKV